MEKSLRKLKKKDYRKIVQRNQGKRSEHGKKICKMKLKSMKPRKISKGFILFVNELLQKEFLVENGDDI